jgi:hypothetical protein
LCEGVEQAAEEDVVGGIWHDLDLEVDVNVVKCELDVAEAAMHVGDGQVGGFYLQCPFYL